MPDKLTKLARGKECFVRLPGICNFDSATTVLAHFRMIGISGMSMKPNSLLGAWACSECHRAVDSNKDADVQLAFAKGVLRTINWLIQDGVVKW